ncbi:hypothetical protein LJR030_004632 [Rhizobium sp. LjRoot30]|uniref:hypothetical protein n=1 Tax=Rhizobium sp. LjRoot30 TaxID=3342320 RepID=UPI003ECD6307
MLPSVARCGLPLVAWASLALLSSAVSAMAHGSERGLVMLLPTGFAQAGGAIVVALSFVALAMLPARWMRAVFAAELPLFPAVMAGRTVLSCLSFLFLALLVGIGLFGTHDPLRNLLPLTIWTMWWVGFTLLQAVVGNLWPWLNPWTGPLAVLRVLSGTQLGRVPFFRLPQSFGYGPAILLFFLFAWYELISLSPQDPPELAVAVGLYWLATFCGMILFGGTVWLERCEPFSIFFRFIGLLAPLVRIAQPGYAGRRFLALAWPGAGCIRRKPLPVSATLFILLGLSSVSFDGLTFTFRWLSFIGINPLEFPGRSAVTVANSFGLVGAALLLGSVFYVAVALGNRMAGIRGGAMLRVMAGHLVYSVIPISIAFHFSHYLTILLINGQYFVLALADPFSLGWQWTPGPLHVTTSFTSNLDSVTRLWAIQTSVIVGGHVVGILLAHMIAVERLGASFKAAVSQVPLAAAMVLYTVFGLWLLSTPVAG